MTERPSLDSHRRTLSTIENIIRQGVKPGAKEQEYFLPRLAKLQELISFLIDHEDTIRAAIAAKRNAPELKQAEEIKRRK
jgi:hypothetical protein